MSEISLHPDENIRPSRVRTLLKTPPHSVEAEQSVLGGLMLDNDAWFNVAEVISEKDFYRPQHRLIFEAMVDLSNDTILWMRSRFQTDGTAHTFHWNTRDDYAFPSQLTEVMQEAEAQHG